MILKNKISEKKAIYFVMIIFSLSFVLRMFYFNEYITLDIAKILRNSDSYFYYLRAKDILSGDFLNSRIFISWPLYAYVLAFLLKVSHNNLAVVYFLQFLLGALNCVLVFFIGRKIFNDTVGFIAGILCSLYGLFIFYDGLLMYTSLALLFNSLFFLWLLKLKALNKRELFLSGVFLGICTITQSFILLFGLIAVLYIISQQKWQLGKILTGFSLFVFGLVMVLGVVSLMNYVSDKNVVLISRNAGLNFYLGNNPEANGLFSCPAYLSSNQEDMFMDAKMLAKISLKKEPTASEVSRFWMDKSFYFITHKPGDYAKLLVSKVKLLFTGNDFICDPEYEFVAGKIKSLRVVFLDLKFLLPLALVGGILSLKRYKEFFLLYLYVASFSLGLVLFFSSSKFRIPIVPFMAIFASFAVYELLHAFKQKKYMKAGLVFIAIALLIYFYNKPVVFKSSTIKPGVNLQDYRAHLDKIGYYEDRGDYENAMKELQLAYAIKPYSHEVRFGMGVVYFYRNDLKKAEQKFLEAIKISPYFVAAYYNLGFLYNQQKRFDQALVVLKKAAYLNPDDASVHNELGRAYKGKGDLEHARLEFQLALKNLRRWKTQDKQFIENELKELENGN